MFHVHHLLEWLILALVCVSGLLLGVAQNDMTLTIIAIVGSVSAFLVTDRLKWLEIDGFVANIAAIIVTAYAIVNFAGGSVAQQLLSVANLLVYLQIVLLFERKTPRLYWQVLVLSILQVVVASAFNMGLEGGLLFIGYMVLAGCTMMLLRLYHDTWQIEQANKPRRKEIEKSRTQLSPKALGPIAVFENKSTSDSIVRGLLRHVSWIGICGLGFTIALFYFVPRDGIAWKGSNELIAGKTGFSKQIDLDQRGRIRLSSRSVLKAKFRFPDDRQPIRLSHDPLFRGISMSKLVVNRSGTTWKPDYDNLKSSSYLAPQLPPKGADYVIQEIEMENSDDPLLHTAFPAYKSTNTPKVTTFVRDIEAFTRGKEGEVIGGTRYQYEFAVLIRNNDSLLKFIPHNFIDRAGYPLPPSSSDPKTRTLLEIDKSRYPELVKLAQQLADSSRFTNPYNIMKTMEDHFLESDEFSYTLDFTNVPRDLRIDPVEDFIANHKSGHCEYYASALTLMLRSQNIPARVVVGFKGGEFNDEDGRYHVKEKHAHAWVEAYVPPGQTARITNNTSLGQTGIWVTLDPTPGSVEEYEDDLVDQATNIFDAANDYWKEFVLGRNEEHEGRLFSGDGAESAAQLLNLDWWAQQIGLREQSESDTGFNILHVIAPLGIISLFAWAWYSNYRKTSLVEQERKESVSLWRRVLGSAVSIVMPKIGKWIIESGATRTTTIHFYRRFMKMMNKYGLHREPAQTHREFANEANEHFHNLTAIDQIQPLIDQITEVFYRARFAGPALDNKQSESIEQAVSELESLLEKAPLRTGTA